MAKKKRKPTRPKQARGELPDPRVLEGVLRQLVSGLSGAPPSDQPQDRARAMLAEAYDAEEPAERARIAREALALDPNCADALVLLAELAPTRREGLELYRQAVAAGERALGEGALEKFAGQFWSALDTRPYMRARAALLHELWALGRRDEALTEAEEMLRLNPGDNQGLRYTLASFLLALERDADLARLLARYNEDSATWAYTRALLAFRREGDSEEARRLLRQAVAANKHVPALLLERAFPPPTAPTYYTPGDEREASNYLNGFLAGWKDTPGALAWLREQTVPAESAARSSLKPPTAVQLRALGKLPETVAVWAIELRQLPTWVRGANDEPVRPWVVIVVDESDDLVLGHQILEQEPTWVTMWHVVATALRQPAAGEPHRPAAIRVRAADWCAELSKPLDKLGIRLEVVEELPELVAMLDELFERLGGPRQPGLLDAPGVTPELVGRVFAAAASFFRQAPWKRVADRCAVRVECARFSGGPWYAVIMGQSGLMRGVALYEDLTVLRELWHGEHDDADNARRSVATALTFDDMENAAPADVNAAQEYGWEVVRPEAFPTILHKERGLSMRPPLVWELELMEACLKTLPEFVSRHPSDDPAVDTLTAGELTLTLAWVE